MNALAPLLAASRDLVAAVPTLAEFTEDRLDGLPYRDVDPAHLPVTATLAERMPAPGPATAALTRAIVAAAPHVRWDQSYTEAEVGAEYLANYGWFNVVSPSGPFVSPRIRVSVGFWGRGLNYPQHRHEPEEIYGGLAGEARFETAGRAAREAGPGDLVHHPPGIVHGFEMRESALLVIAFWKGADLLARSTLEVEP